jgi:hypothetical protein
VDTVMSLEAAIGPHFSADGAHFLVDVALRDGRSLLLDGREVFHGTQHITQFAMAPDGAWVSFLSSEVLPFAEQMRTGKGTRDLLVHRGQTVEIDGEPACIAVTPDGAHVAYAVNFSLKDDGAVFLDGKKVARGFAPRLLTLSPDGKRWAVANSIDRYGGGEIATIDGIKSARYHAIWGLLFSPDGKHVAYMAYTGKGEQATVVLDGRELARYKGVDEELAFTASGRLVARASRGASSVVLFGTREIPTGHVYDTVVNGDTVAWTDEIIENNRLVARAFLDGAEVFREDAGVFNRMADRNPAFIGLAVAASSGKRVAFMTRTGTHLVDAGLASTTIAEQGEPIAFDAEGKRLAVRIHANDGVGIDILSIGVGAPGPVVSGPRFSGPTEVFLQTVRFVPDGLEYFARRESDLVRVHIPSKI